MKVFITKYALTKGIFEKEMEQSIVSPEVVTCQGICWTEYYHGEGKDWHRTRESAFAKAEAMREAKIKSIEKQLARLKKLKF